MQHLSFSAIIASFPAKEKANLFRTEFEM